jgi:fructose-bisphosphate aldolase, class I
MSERLEDIAQAMTAEGKGILAADESTGTIKKRFDSISTDSTPVTRRDYREMLFSASDAMRKYISGVILYDETIRQTALDGRPLVELIRAAGSIPGIKVDNGAKEMAFHPGEKVTEGLDGLRERLKEYHGMGARFAKWRAVIDIADHTPTWACIKANAHALARYAALCQEENIVPIVEPEVLMDGPVASHDIERCYDVTEHVLNACSTSCSRHGCGSRAWCSSPTWSLRARTHQTRPRPNRWPRRPSAASRRPCRPPSPESLSCRAASRTSRRPDICRS